jgi:IPT/TIG domain-containing protein
VEWVPSSINGVSGQTTGPLTVNEYDKYEACPGLSGITEGPYAADATFQSDDPEIASVDTNGTQVSLDLAGGVLITARWETSTHNELNNECAEGGCETTCIPQVNEVSATLQVGVRPKVESVTPDRGLIGTSNAVTIGGRGFVSGAQVAIDGGSISGATLQSATSITCTYLIDDNASGGNHRVTVTVNGRASTDNVNFYVQIPTSLNVLSVTNLPDGSGTQDGCPTGSFGIKVSIRYQVKDQAGGVIQTDKMEPQEKVTSEVLNGTSLGDPVPTFTDIGPSRITGTSQFTDSNGEFLDAPFGICEPFAISSYTFTQTIRVLASNQNPYVVKTHNLTATGTTAGHGTITNGSDVQSSRP